MTGKIRHNIKYRAHDYIRFLGPGLLLAVAAAGESGIAEAVEIGAHFGYALIWVIAITLIYKFAFVNGIARYTMITGKTIFQGLISIPGPKNWGGILVMAIYFLEMFAFAGMLLLGGIFIDYIIPGINSTEMIVFISLSAILILLWKESYERLEHTIVAIALLLFIGIAFSLTQFPISLSAMIPGLVPHIPPSSLLSIMALMGAVGSSLNLLLYSIWLKEKIGDEKGPAFYRKAIQGVNLDLIIAFLFVGIITVLFISLGVTGFSISYLEHGEVFSVDALIAQVLYVISSIPYGPQTFLATGYLIMFGAVLTGMDGRARAISEVLHTGYAMKWDERTTFRLILLLFTMIIVSGVLIGQPMMLVHGVSAIASVFFAVMGFIIIYLNMEIKEPERPNRLWTAVMTIGSLIFLMMALFMEEGIIMFGIPLAERMIVVAFVVLIFAGTTLFRDLIQGNTTWIDRFWTALIFGALSIYGTFRGIPFEGVIINFRDLGPILAGIVGGPVIGAAAGIIGAVYRYQIPGMEKTALACAIATIVAGIVAGFFTRMFRGDITYLRGFILIAIVEAIHIFIIVPLFSDIGTFADFMIIVRATLLPMIFANTLGVILFCYIIQMKGYSLTTRFTKTPEEKPLQETEGEQ
ncbi:Nramp family divalent metal transporter [Methanogenium organophilum]|uniref:Nramp family divalent metal transporter n=1 Tax=Methanogenium organophilum TaxID=2199 RepID=A0A9X9T8E4_METOG|nr:Nramp family divalent metal transporter [Methanogenium organophilum]WAI02363.1 Nramp family divalent metal transporter [Methanogenium organophilum]